MLRDSRRTGALIFLNALLFVTSLLALSARAWAQETVERLALETSLVNTNFNTYQKDGSWEATMGPLTPFQGGIVCDNVAQAKGDPQLYRRDAQALWFVAPSDILPQFGLQRCKPNPHGGEPTCEENWSFCGRKIRIRCRAGATWCAQAGDPSLLQEMLAGRRPINNYLPDYYVQKTREQVGDQARVPSSLVLMITDFCPAAHSDNVKSGQCQRPQLDISTSAFLLMGRQNAQGYINGNIELDAELLPEGDGASLGPEYGQGGGSPQVYPVCKIPGSDPDGDGWGWENGSSCKVF